MSENTMYMEFDREFDPVAVKKPFALNKPFEVEQPEHRPEDIHRLALETMQGKHGRLRKDREASLGEQYQDVMAEVIRIRLQGA